MIKKRYNNLNALRSIAAISIVLMHVLSNFHTINSLPVFNVVAQAGNYVPLFFILSGFGMCCGYYDKVKNNEMSINQFYISRYLKLLPFFALLVLVDVGYAAISNFSMSVIYEAFSDLTLLFAFLPNSNIQVIGVGWSLGVIFAFYCIFPFFVFMIWDKFRAVLSFVITLLLSILCSIYFTVDGAVVACNLLRWLCYFILGGIIFLWRDEIEKKLKQYGLILSLITIIVTIVAFLIPNEINGVSVITFKTLIVFGLWVLTSIGEDNIIMNNKVTSFISDISFEVYLSHMFIYRVLEKIHLTRLFENEVISYVFTSIVVLILSIAFSFYAKKIIAWLLDLFKKKEVAK